MATAAQKSPICGHVGRDAAVAGSAAIALAPPVNTGNSHCRTAPGSDGKGQTHSHPYHATRERAACAPRVPRDGARRAALSVVARRLMACRSHSSSQCGRHRSIVTEAPSGLSVASSGQDESCPARIATPTESQGVIQHNGINDPRRQVMAAKHKMTVSAQPTNRRPSSTERRAALAASLANQQARLKQEAAERRARHTDQNAEAGPTPSRVASESPDTPR